jgi:hypothetical protein
MLLCYRQNAGSNHDMEKQVDHLKMYHSSSTWKQQ